MRHAEGSPLGKPLSLRGQGSPLEKPLSLWERGWGEGAAQDSQPDVVAPSCPHPHPALRATFSRREKDQDAARGGIAAGESPSPAGEGLG
ncbi:UNVERIFIED_ORG: hypothetical protein ABIB63_000036 [Xanthomonas axonopodis]